MSADLDIADIHEILEGNHKLWHRLVAEFLGLVAVGATSRLVVRLPLDHRCLRQALEAEGWWQSGALSGELGQMWAAARIAAINRRMDGIPPEELKWWRSELADIRFLETFL